MATYNFTGANGDPLPAGLTTQNGAFEIQSNRLVATAVSSVFTQPSLADGTVEVDVNAGGSAATGTSQIMCRWTSSSDYIALLFRHSDGLLRIFKKVGGTLTQLGANYTIPAYSNVATYTLSITTLANSIKAFNGGTEVISTTSTHNQTATTSGVELRYVNQDSVDNLTIPDAVVSNTISFSPVVNFPYQRTGTTTTINFPVTWTGTPTTIEYSVDSGAWTEGDASPVGGSSTIAVPLQAGTSNVAFRFSNDVAVTAASNVIVGDIFAVIGQSNGQGAGTNNQTFTAGATATAYNFGNNDVRSLLADPYDSNVGQIDAISQDGSNGGSWVVRFANYYLQELDVPVGFIPCCKGGSIISEWQKNSTSRLGGLNLYESMERRINAVGGSVAGVIFDQGESDALNTNGTLASSYETDLNQLFTDIQATFPCKFIIRQLQTLPSTYQGDGTTTGEIPIRSSQNAVANSRFDTYISVSMADINLVDEGGDGIHFKTNGELDLVGSRMFDVWAISQDIYSTLTLSITGIPDGTYQTILHNGTTEVFKSTLTYTSGAATTPALSIAAGIALTGYVIDNEATPVDGAVITGVTA